MLFEAELLLGRCFIRVPNAAAPAKSTGDLHVLVDGVWTKLPARWGFRDRRYALHVGRVSAVAAWRRGASILENSSTTGVYYTRIDGLLNRPPASRRPCAPSEKGVDLRGCDGGGNTISGRMA